jgi:hypothetical protein
MLLEFSGASCDLVSHVRDKLARYILVHRRAEALRHPPSRYYPIKAYTSCKE